jgi:hypothetical protein
VAPGVVGGPGPARAVARYRNRWRPTGQAGEGWLRKPLDFFYIPTREHTDAGVRLVFNNLKKNKIIFLVWALQWDMKDTVPMEKEGGSTFSRAR